MPPSAYSSANLDSHNTFTKELSMIRALTMSLAVLGLAGCTTVQLPADRLGKSEASIRGAEEVGASGVPDAKLHLQLAKDQTVTAKKMAADGDKRATLVLARAESDAELALVLAREVSVHADAVRATEDLKAVRARVTP
jgi:hypothetical protein